MKKLLCTICLLLVVSVSGCASWYWYQPGKTLEQCRQDFLECNYEASKHSYVPHGFGVSPMSAEMQTGFQKVRLCMQCMQARGYYGLYEKQLPVGTRTLRLDQNVAGK